MPNKSMLDQKANENDFLKPYRLGKIDCKKDEITFYSEITVSTLYNVDWEPDCVKCFINNLFDI